MSHKNIQELTLRLSSALDQNYNVIKFEEVLSVINALENTTITKDQLETTRLAKYINQLRRRTTNEQLAKRAKCLLKKWREKLLASNDNKKTNVLHTSLKLSTHYNNNENNAQSDCSPNFHLNHGLNTYRRHTTQSLLPTSDCNNFIKSSKNAVQCSGSHAKPSSEILSYDVIDNTNSGFDDAVMSVPLSHNNKTFNCSNSSSIKCINDVPIVIDLHDTNSLDTSMSTNIPTVTREFSITGELPAIGQIVSLTNSRHSLSKRKDINLEFENKLVCSTTSTMLSSNVTSIQQRDNETLASGVAGVGVGQDTKTHSLCTLSISDILSLSNSSMGSEKQRFGEVTKESTADLTFAGKFKKKCMNPLNSHTSNNNNELPGFNSCSNNEREPLDLAHQKFAPFASLMSINSNDSTTSNSRILNLHMSQEQHSKSASTAITTATSTDTSITPINIASNENATNKIKEKETRSEKSVGTASLTDLKVPKKRGRKKGSKGVDAIIAKETSLSSEMLIRGGMCCKKVKTTKELYAEMKNRKFGLNSSPSQHGYSDPSLHSPRTLESFSTNAIGLSSNATNRCTIENTALLHTQPLAEKERDIVESDCFTLTSEPSRDSAALIKSDGDNNRLNANSILIDSNSNSVGLRIDPSVQTNVIIPGNYYHTSIATIKEQLYELICNLPPMLNCHDIKIQCQAEIVPCTCRIIQIPNHNEDIMDYENDTIKVVNNNNINSNKGNGTSNEIPNSREAENKAKHHMNHEDGKKEQIRQTPIIIKKVVPKSIFDVDFDDENDPLPIIIADLKANQFKLQHSSIHSITDNSNDVVLSENAAVGKDGFKNSSRTTNNMDRMKLSPLAPAEELPLAPTIVSEPMPTLLLSPVHLKSLIAEIDEKCLAKYRFEIQTQDINEFHINTLHNFYIPNVNGNWNEASVLEPPPQYTTAVSSPKSFYNFIDHKEKMDGCNVVPKYGALIKESLIKNLSQVSWSELKINHNCKLVEKSYGELKFFGVIQTRRNKEDDDCKESKDTAVYNKKSNNNKSLQLAGLTVDDWSNSKCNNRRKNLSFSKIINENKLSILSRKIKINENGSGSTTTKTFEYILQKRQNKKRQKKCVTTTLPRNNGKHFDEREEEGKEEVKKMENGEKTALQLLHQHSHQDYQHNCNAHTTNCTTETSQMSLNKSLLSPCESDNNHSNIFCDKDNQTTITHFTRNGQMLDKMPFNENDSKMHHGKQFQGRRKRRKKFQNQCYKKGKKNHRVLFLHDELQPTTNIDDYTLNTNNSNSINNNNISNINSNSNHINCNSTNYSDNFSGTSNSEAEFCYSDEYDKDDYTENVNTLTHNHITVNNTKNTAECYSNNQKIDNNNVNVNVDPDEDNSDVIMENDDINLNSFTTVTATALTPETTIITAATPLFKQKKLQNPYGTGNTKSNENINNNDSNSENDNNDNDDNVEREFSKKLQLANNNAQLLSINKIYQETKLQMGDDKNTNNADISPVIYQNQEVERQLIPTTTTNYNNNDSPREDMLPLPEYRNGWRQVNQGINNCQHWQQFAEWHQVLQLRSYNNELLTVLPYVIIE